MRIAIIDLGTNTFNLIIADTVGKGYETIFKNKISVKLGEGGIDRGIIAAKPFKRGLEAMVNHKATIGLYDAEKIFAFATSAIRTASNGTDFIDKVKAATDIDIHVIDGQTEASLIYHGVKQAVDLGEKTCLIMDIGGGSTEFILANKDQVFWKQSSYLGVSRLHEKFKPHDLILEEEIRQIEEYVHLETRPLAEAIKVHPTRTLVGSSGSFDSFAEMIDRSLRKEESFKERTSYEFHLEDFRHFHELLIKSTVEDRLKIKGLARMRVDMIVIASILINFMLNEFGITHMYLSKFALREGVLWELTLKHQDG